MSTDKRRRRKKEESAGWKKEPKFTTCLAKLIPYLLVHHLQKKEKLELNLKKVIFLHYIPAALAPPPRRKFFLTSGRAN